MRTKHKEISIMSCIFCILVMFIHVSSIPLFVADKESVQYFMLLAATRSSSFVVQGFVFISAFKLFSGNMERNYLNFIFKKLKNIYFPYLIWSSIYYFNFCYHNYFPFSVNDLLGYWWDGSITAPFYFIIFIMQFYFLFPFWKKLYKLPAYIVIPLSFVVMIFSRDFLESLFATELPLDRFFTTYLLYWTLGAYSGKNPTKTLDIIKKNKTFLVISYVFFCNCNIFYFYKLKLTGIYFPYLESLHQLYCVVAVYFCFLLATKVKYTKLIDEFSNITFSLYLTHCFVLFFVDRLAERIDFSTIRYEYFFRLVMLYSVSVGSQCLWFWIKKRIKSGKTRR